MTECGNEDCNHLGPNVCDWWIPCDCEFETYVHCDECVHAEVCHKVKQLEKETDNVLKQVAAFERPKIISKKTLETQIII